MSDMKAKLHRTLPLLCMLAALVPNADGARAASGQHAERALVGRVVSTTMLSVAASAQNTKPVDDRIMQIIRQGVAKAKAAGVSDVDTEGCMGRVEREARNHHAVISRLLQSKDDFVLGYAAGTTWLTDFIWYAQPSRAHGLGGWTMTVCQGGHLLHANLSVAETARIHEATLRLPKFRYGARGQMDGGCGLYLGRRDGHLWSRVTSASMVAPKDEVDPAGVLVRILDRHFSDDP